MINFINTIFFKKGPVIIRLAARLYIIFFVVPLFGSEITNFLHKDGYKLAGVVVGVYITDTALRKCLSCPPVEVYLSNQEALDRNRSATEAAAYVFKKLEEEKRGSQENIIQSVVTPSFSLCSYLKIRLNLVSSAMYVGAGFLGWGIVKSYE